MLSTISVVPDWLWLVFILGIVVLIVIDLNLFSEGHQAKSSRAALMESAMWIAIALGFNTWFWITYGSKLGLEFLTCYLVEKSLSVDNLFVIFMIFNSLKVPKELQHRVLFYGVLGAIVLRGIFIILGATVVNTFHWILYGFGLVLIVTAVKFLRKKDENVDPERNWAIHFLRKFIPISNSYDGHKFFTKRGSILEATPLFVAVVFIESTDLVFAVDSIPAVFAITNDGFVAFSSNILAILGLRALFFVLAVWVSRLRYLEPGLAAILGFIGVKMLIVDLVHIPNFVSLIVIVAILVTASLSSWYVAKME